MLILCDTCSYTFSIAQSQNILIENTEHENDVRCERALCVFRKKIAFMMRFPHTYGYILNEMQ